ncbi:GNAT family N-acetyltransferase [bacterium]|nr:GNAT family N-acetyltransferase [bacterium]
MVAYRLMDESCPVHTCLHGAPIQLADCRPGAEAYVETIGSLPAGSVAGALVALAQRYGASGTMALDAGRVVGKIRFWPEALEKQLGGLCVQQEEHIRPLIEAAETLPPRVEAPVLRLNCVQVAADHRRQGIAGKMLDAALEWARRTGWHEVRAMAVCHIPPLLDWCGQLSRLALERRGFQTISQAVHPQLREGVVAQRAGAHGAEVQTQWADDFADVSDDQAGTMYELALPLRSGN